MPQRKHLPRPTSGRKYKLDGQRRRTAKTIAVSFKREDVQVLEQLQRILEQDGLPVSETVVDALRLKFGISDLNLVRAVLLEKYAAGELVGPRLFKTFDDILIWELKNSEDLLDIADKWGATRQQMACLVYLYFARPRAYYPPEG
jgi:hypothetical protein